MGRGGAHRVRGNNGVAARRRRNGGSPVGRRGQEAKEREEGATDYLGTRSQGRVRGERKGGAAATERPLYATQRGRWGMGRGRRHAAARDII
jgi:hypothetical protein